MVRCIESLSDGETGRKTCQGECIEQRHAEITNVHKYFKLEHY